MNYNALAEKGVALLSGAASMADGANRMSQINDIPGYARQFDGVRRLGSYGYGSYDQMLNDYSYLNGMQYTTPSFDEIRGMTDGQKVGNVLSSTISGATTGASVGGLYGAIGGAAFGLGAGLKSVFEGDAKARAQQQYNNYTRDYSFVTAADNMNTASGNLIDANNRRSVATMRKDGGKISLQAFADKVLRHQRSSDITHSAGIIRQHCKGGTMIRIKMK